MDHNINLFRPEARLHTHLGTCIICGSSAGDTTVYVKCVEVPAGRSSLDLEGMGVQLCPQCEPPRKLTDGHRALLRSFGHRWWANLKKRGCPCCEAGLTWYPTPTHN
jgi:hypothetical protein